MDAKTWFYRFDTLSTLLEDITPFRIHPSQGIIGFRTPGMLGLTFGIGAKRTYPYGYFMILPAPVRPVIPREVPPDMGGEGITGQF